MWILRITALTALLAISSLADAGPYTKLYNPFPVVIAGDTLPLPFFGGMDEPKPNLLDFDRDGLTDLFISEPTGKLIYLHNEGSANEPLWVVITERLGNIDVGFWNTLADIDGDGDYDLFCDSRNASIMFYRNESIGNNLIFTFVDSSFHNLPTSFNTTPAFVDLDSDNDLDFFHGGVSGRLTYYRNDGNSTLPTFTFVTEFYDSILAFPSSPVTPDANPEHGFSNIRFADLDSDNDLDLFWGDLFSNSLYHFANYGDSALSDFFLEQEFFLPATTSGFNHSAFADLDGDNDLDMLLGVNNGAVIDNLRLYRNIGTPTQPNIILEQLNMLGEIDFASSSVPTFGDLDADKDLDLVVGSSNGQLAYFENRGTKLEPLFVMTTDLLSGIDIGFSSFPSLYDWDNDSDLDLLIGVSVGRVEYWENVGTTSIFNPIKRDAQLAGIKVDQLATPFPVDLNNDNLPDLVVGEWDFNNKANILLYENIGTLGNPVLQLVTNKLIPEGVRAFTIPRFYDMNSDGIKDLIIGTDQVGLTLFLNNAPVGSFPDSSTLIMQTDSLPGYDDGQRTVFTMVDIDLDGDYDVFTGEQFGGLNFYLHEGNCCIGSVGNADKSLSEEPTVGDVSIIIAHLFETGVDLPCHPEANIYLDTERRITVADIARLVDYLFVSASPLPPCP